MWIISNDGRLAVNAEYVTKIEATTNGKVKATTIANGTPNADAYIGSYDNDIQAGIAVNMLLDAIEADGRFNMPTGTEPFMDVEYRPQGGAFQARGKKTTGKTK
ncbi:MAG: hypothetical protein J5965_15220 [Aeriscardovia sp.]|nr:hypothetical protein [Aeriscardovia sp.]